VLYGVPENIGIDIEVRVNDAVPHGSHHGPRHIRVGFLNVFGDVIGSLANDHQVSGYGLVSSIRWRQSLDDIHRLSHDLSTKAWLQALERAQIDGTSQQLLEVVLKFQE
jgi:hypothetical protein